MGARIRGASRSQRVWSWRRLQIQGAVRPSRDLKTKKHIQSGMTYSYSPRHKIVLDNIRRSNPLMKDYWVSPHKLYEADSADRSSWSHYLRLPRYRRHLEFESFTYPSYFDYKERMLTQYPMLRKTWRVNLGGIILDTFRRSRFGLQDYWSNPQRGYCIGSVSRDSRKHLLVLPGNTGISDVNSTIKPGYFHYKHKLVL
ncbi:uncharacterized protein LOC144508997 isoform X2 [Mustelus asterias]